ncbi:MAG TPA: hypothetical protein DCG75_10105 [Bacteroidales bacterium]|jgi:hypothetical protein|nr:hypothetical protein [Bacteroidales bacterium]
MTITCLKNGKEIALRDPLDLDFIEYDVVKDYLKVIGHLERNPEARVEIDLTEPFIPKFNLINCSNSFTQKFNQVINRKKFA